MLIKASLEAVTPIAPKYSDFTGNKRITYIATAQKIGDDIICVDFWNKGSRMLELRFFANSKSFILRRERVTDGSNRWVRHSLDRHLTHDEYCTGSSSHDCKVASDFLLQYMDKPYYYDKDNLRRLVSAFISKIFSEKRAKANQSKEDKLQAAMKLFGPYPKDIKDYLHNDVFPGYLFFGKLEKGKRDAACSKCGKNFQIGRESKHKRQTICPKCGKSVFFHDKRYIGSIKSRAAVCIAGKSPDGHLILRWGESERTFLSGTTETIEMDDYFRMVYRIEHGEPRIQSYEYKYVYPWGSYWREKSYRCSDMAYVYPQNIEAVFGKTFYNVSLPDELQSCNQPMDFVGLLDNLKNLKPTEYLVKMGMIRLASQLDPATLTKGKDFQSILGVSRQYLPMYRDYNISLQEHEVIKSSQTWVSTENFEKLRQLNFNTGQVPAMCDLLQTMSFEKFVNYFLKQRMAYKNTLDQIMTWYRDYIQMAQSLNVDLSHKSVCFPTKIKEAHDRLLPQFKEVQTEIEDENFRQARENLYRNLKEFAKDGLAIVFPQSKSDFIREGNSLSHCVGNIQSYFTNHMSGEKMIFFVREAGSIDTPFVTMEIDMRRLVILQLYGYGDKAPNPEVRKFANAFLKQLSKKEKAERRTEQWQEYTASRAGA